MKKMPKRKTSYPITKGPNYSGRPKVDALLRSLNSVIEICARREDDVNSELLAKTLEMLVRLIEKPILLNDKLNYITPKSPNDVYGTLTCLGLDKELAVQTVKRLIEIHKESNDGLFQQTL